MLKKQATNQPNSQRNDKFFSKENLAGIIALVAVVLVALYVISTHLDLPVLIVPSDAVEMTYPASILNDAAEEMADSMRGTDGVYRVKVNDDGSMTVKMSPERQQAILDVASNSVVGMTLLAIDDETAIRDYTTEEDHTILNATVIKDAETLEDEIHGALYAARLYHVCNLNNDVQITVNYIDVMTNEVYLSEAYDIEGTKLSAVTY